MRRSFYVALVSFSLFSTSVFAKSLSIEQLVDQFFMKGSKSTPVSTSARLSSSEAARPWHLDPRCDDRSRRGTCVDAVCKRLGAYGCDDMSEVERVSRLCRGIFDGGCVESVCTRLGAYGCDDISEIERVTNVCRGGVNGSCVDQVCKRLGTYGCDDMSEVEKVVGLCRGNDDGSCIESVCSRLGAYGCDDIREIERVAKTCSGER